MVTLFYDYKSIWETLNHQVLNHSFWLFSGLIASQRWKHSFTCNTCWRNSQQCLIKTFKACAFFCQSTNTMQIPLKDFCSHHDLMAVSSLYQLLLPQIYKGSLQNLNCLFHLGLLHSLKNQCSLFCRVLSLMSLPTFQCLVFKKFLNFKWQWFIVFIGFIGHVFI